MKTKKIKALIIEDSEDDLKLMLRELDRGSYEIEYKVVMDAKELVIALKEDWDVIISDYSLPEFNGYEALKMFNEKGIDTPFIIVSGTIGEEFAVKMMRTGVKDYIMKNNLARLLPSIEREILEAKIRKEKKQAENKLHVSEEKYRTLIENMGEGIAITDYNEKFVFVNPAAEKIFGVGPGELIGECLDTFHTGEKYKEVENRTKERRQGKSGFFEDEIILKDGSKKVIFVNATPWFDDKNFKGTFAIFSDITERKHAEELLVEKKKKYQELVDSISDVLF